MICVIEGALACVQARGLANPDCDATIPLIAASVTPAVPPSSGLARLRNVMEHPHTRGGQEARDGAAQE